MPPWTQTPVGFRSSEPDPLGSAALPNPEAKQTLALPIGRDSTDFLPEVVIAPPAIFLILAREKLRKGIEVAAQNVFDKPNGAFTGEISAEQLKDSGITWALAGHSERRVILAEDDSVSKILESVSGQEGTEPLKLGFAHLMADTKRSDFNLVYCKKN